MIFSVALRITENAMDLLIRRHDRLQFRKFSDDVNVENFVPWMSLIAFLSFGANIFFLWEFKTTKNPVYAGREVVNSCPA